MVQVSRLEEEGSGLQPAPSRPIHAQATAPWLCPRLPSFLPPLLPVLYQIFLLSRGAQNPAFLIRLHPLPSLHHSAPMDWLAARRQTFLVRLCTAAQSHAAPGVFYRSGSHGNSTLEPTLLHL